MTSGTTRGHPVPEPVTGRSGDWWRDKVRDWEMRGVFGVLCDMGAEEDASGMLDFAGVQGWMSDLKAQAESLAILDRTFTLEPSDDELRYSVWALYAASRVRDALLLAHQPDPADDSVAELDKALYRQQPACRTVPAEQITTFFAAMGCIPVTEPVFDPILHEIVTCEPASTPTAPIEITGQIWPALVIGELVFTRAGVRVRAGSAIAEAGVADRSCLDWEYWRRHRTTVDGSFWWGHNSQWRTAFRRDYITDRGHVYNFDAGSHFHKMTEDSVTRANRDPELPPDQADEYIRHRSLIRSIGTRDIRTPNHIVDERRR
jgi:hypothetical protein